MEEMEEQVIYEHIIQVDDIFTVTARIPKYIDAMTWEGISKRMKNYMKESEGAMLPKLSVPNKKNINNYSQEYDNKLMRMKKNSQSWSVIEETLNKQFPEIQTTVVKMQQRYFYLRKKGAKQ